MRHRPTAQRRRPARGPGALALLLAAGCTTSLPEAPVLTAVSPAVVEAGLDTPVLVRGSHLEPRVTLDFDRPSRSEVDRGFRAILRGPATVELTQVTWLDAGLLAAVVPAGAGAGTYQLQVLDPWDAGAVLPAALQVVPGCPLTYLDLDGDGFGDPGSAARSCEPGRVDGGADCNDQDPLTHPGAREVCNGLDDDCNGLADDGACTLASPAWALRTDTGAGAQDWATAWSYAPGALWVAGGAQAWVRTGAGAFRSVSTGCPSPLGSSWAAPDGWLLAGGGSTGAGRLATDTPELRDGGCFDPRTTTDQVVGLVGFAMPDGGTQLRGVARRGALLRWARGGGAPVELAGGLSGSARMEDLHGSDPDTLFAVGGLTEDGDRMRVWRWAEDAGWQDEHVTSGLSLPSGTLHGLWVLGPGSVVAVGDKGTALEKRGGAWRLLPGLDAGTTLQAVRAFGVARVYAVSAQGQVLRWDGRAWTVLRDDPPLSWSDLSGTSEEDLWGVGRDGAVVHWPE